jgi:hypothetical protein
MSSATDFPGRRFSRLSAARKTRQVSPAGEVRRACGAAHLRQCLMLLWCQGMNIGVLQLDGDISVLAIMPALPCRCLVAVPLPLPLPLNSGHTDGVLADISVLSVFLPVVSACGRLLTGTGAVVNGAGKPSPPCRASIALSQV